jgi:hypothetical protein
VASPLRRTPRWPLKCPLRETARVSVPCAFASQMPSNGSQTSFRAGDPTMEPYARLKGRLRYKAADSALHLQVSQPHAFRAIPHLDPALQARLSSALQRPDLKPQTRAKIEKILKPNESHPAGRHHQTCQPVSTPIRSFSKT